MAIFLYANLSRRLGAVTKMPPYYRWFFVGIVLTSIALISSVVRGAASLSCDESASIFTTLGFGLLAYHLPLFLGTVINLIVAWKYWGWLLVGE